VDKVNKGVSGRKVFNRLTHRQNVALPEWRFPDGTAEIMQKVRKAFIILGRYRSAAGFSTRKKSEQDTAGLKVKI